MDQSVVEKVAGRVSLFGGLVALFGIVSCGMYFFGYNLDVLMWVDRWGPLMGWVIRFGLIGGGAALYVIAGKFDKSDERNAQAASEAEAAVRSHPRTQKVLADLSQRLRLSFEPTTDPDTYVIRRIYWHDASHRYADPTTNVWYGPADAAAVRVALYLERQNDPKRLIVGQDLTDGTVTQQEPPMGAWSAMVG